MPDYVALIAGLVAGLLAGFLIGMHWCTPADVDDGDYHEDDGEG